MKEVDPLKNIATSNTTLTTGVLFASPQAPGRGGFYAPAPTMTAVKDVAHLRCWRPPV